MGFNWLGFFENDIDVIKELFLIMKSVKVKLVFLYLVVSEDFFEKEFMFN